MTFTDYDLKRLKDCPWIHSGCVSCGFDMDGLLARLEAAEACAWYAGDDEPEYLRNPLWVAWRKVAGK